MTLVVHPHFHGRRTGITGHVEAVASTPALDVEARVIGGALAPTAPRIGWGELWRRIRRERVVWHAHRNLELLAGLALRLVARDLQVVFTRHSAQVPSGYTRWLAARASARVALTAQVSTALGLPATVVPHGVDLARFHPPEDRGAAWRALGLGGARGIGVVGRVRPAKGQGDFAEAVAPLLSAHPEWRAALVGLVKDGERAWAEALRTRAGDALVLAGEQRDPAPWYRGLTVLVHPSHDEAFSLVLLEAMASGCCVVATRLPHHPDVIDHGRTGLLYDVGDVAGLRALLAGLLEEPERAEALGRNAAEEARRRLGVEHEAAALAALYRAGR